VLGSGGGHGDGAIEGSGRLEQSQLRALDFEGARGRGRELAPAHL
jgi:hypothetical protein